MYEHPGEIEERLMRLFGLTRWEARVAISLASGKDYEGVAMELGITFRTVDTHAKELLAKTMAKSRNRLTSIVFPELAQYCEDQESGTPGRAS